MPISFLDEYHRKGAKEISSRIAGGAERNVQLRNDWGSQTQRDEIIEDYSDVAENAMNALEEGFESAMTAMILPKNLRKYFRTFNHIEMLNRELKWRSRVIGIFPMRDVRF